MPTYSFKNKETGEVHDLFLKSYSAKEEYLKNNPQLESTITQAPQIGFDTVSLGVTKNDSGFNDMMQRIGDANPGSAVEKKYNRRTSKRVAVDKIAHKYGYRKGSK